MAEQLNQTDVTAGQPYPLGATYDGSGTNFALFSANADAVELCLYDNTGQHEIARLMLTRKTTDIWHGYIANLKPGCCYGYRVHGPFLPEQGHRFNANKLLLDPYAKQSRGEFVWHKSHYGFDSDDALEDLSFDSSDNAKWMPKAVVVEPFNTPNKGKNTIPWQQTSVVETHVRGFTINHPDVPASIKGTFAGMAQPEVIKYFKDLGVSTVELLPVQGFIDEHFLEQKGLTNYWGYNSLSFFAPHQNYLSGDSIEEFRQMVDAFHEAELEVVIDVVYNHTCEGNHLGPTVSFRGIDNASYYQLMPDDKRYYVNDSGCGNTLNVHHPRVMQLIIDSLRYWVEVMGVDGFRFDLASILGRQPQGFSQTSAFFQIIAQDPVLANCKLIAEPWDLGPGGYQLGNYPAPWSEWNDRYRDTIRKFWAGDRHQLPELARRLHGSSDFFEGSGRPPYASINFITSHDGFTLRDIVSYQERHNLANLEDNNDGHGSNHSKNYGVEGPTDDPIIDGLRWQMQRNFLATLMMSQGVPMLLAGDEMGRTQQGNNNAYCQDNDINWIDWAGIGEEQAALTQFTTKLLALRKQFSVLQPATYRHQPTDDSRESIEWFNQLGSEMTTQDWDAPDNKFISYLLTESGGNKYLLVIFNGADTAQSCRFPNTLTEPLHLIIDTANDSSRATHSSVESGLILAAHSMQILSSDPI